MNIFVGNLLFEATEGDVRKVFEAFGGVASVAIVMDKKGIKSRGFGFVEMPVDQEAQEAIANLDGKEFMGRVLNVSPAYPKSEADQDRIKKKILKPKIQFEAKEYPQGEAPEKKKWFDPVFKKTGGYKGGRRTRSFIRRRVAAGVIEPLPERKTKENPMRWRKKRDQAHLWHKSQGEAKPWQKGEGGPRPWRKDEGQVKPWKKSDRDLKPWRKAEKESKPWRKGSGQPQQGRFKNRKKFGAYKNRQER
jgi:RNA recognition motif-containing protein